MTVGQIIELRTDSHGFPDGGGAFRKIQTGAQGVLICNYEGSWADEHDYLGVEFFKGARGVYWVPANTYYKRYSPLESLAMMAE